MSRRERTLALLRAEPGLTIEEVRRRFDDPYRRDDVFLTLERQGIIERQHNPSIRRHQYFPTAMAVTSRGDAERVIVKGWNLS